MDKEILKKFKQMDNDERRKLMQVIQEKNSGKDEKMEWMYQERNIDSEEYLLGKKVDKAFIDATFEQPELRPDAPGALFTEVIARRSQLDMQLKMKEDPLYIIRQKEMEAKRKVLINPVKMQKLKAMIEKETRSKQEHKKSKKRKKSRKQSDSSSSDEEADELVKKYLAIKRQKDGSKTEDEKAKSEAKGSNDMTRPTLSSSHGSKTDRIPSATLKKTTRYDSSDDDQPEDDKKYGLNARSRETSYQHKRVDYSSINVKKPMQELPKRRRLTEQEKEEARRQMMSNAKDRDIERERNVKHYKERERKEEESSNSKGKSFIEPLMRDMIAQSSVEDRIKSSRHTAQRSKDNFDKNFARR